MKVGVREVVFEGADFGKQPNILKKSSYFRSLLLEKALHPDTLIAYQYNQQPIFLNPASRYDLLFHSGTEWLLLNGSNPFD
jgi:hypothetical protein